MKILFTGATGFIGGHLKARLEREGHQIVCFGRDSRIGETWTARFDAVINCMGELDRLDMMAETNTRQLIDFLNLFRLNGSGRFIQIGSSSETGPIEGPRHEETFCRPSNLYEATKLAATNLCLGYAAQFDLDVCVARPFTVYGPNDKARKMLPTMWRAFCEHQTLHCYPAGHDWIHVDDFVSGIVALLNAPAAITRGQIFHFGTGISTPNEKIVEMFSHSVGGGLDVVYHTEKLRPYDVTDWRADSTKARTMLGWEPQTPIGKGIHDCVMDQWFKEDRG